MLVILGLLVGGVLSGQSLIRAAELRSTYTQYSTFITALHSFRDKYQQPPGDMNNATAFWGALSAVDDATCQALPANGSTATCNGNGNGQINTTYVVGGDEQHRAWQHMANAGLVSGSFRGTTPAERDISVPGVKINGTGFWRLGYSSSSGGTSGFTYPNGNLLRMAGILVKPEESWNMDTKFDDGRPALGRMIGWKGDATRQCTDRANQALDVALDAAANYNLSLPDSICIFIEFPNAV